MLSEVDSGNNERSVRTFAIRDRLGALCKVRIREKEVRAGGWGEEAEDIIEGGGVLVEGGGRSGGECGVLGFERGQAERGGLGQERADPSYRRHCEGVRPRSGERRVLGFERGQGSERGGLGQRGQESEDLRDRRSVI